MSRSRFARDVSLLILLVVLAACAPNAALHNNQTAPTSFAADLPEHVVPILPVSRELVTVPVRLNGESAYRFVLDTGATPTALFGNRRLDSLDLELNGDFPVTGVGRGADARASIASPLDVGIGSLDIHGMTPVHMSWQRLPFFHAEDTVFWDGVLGYDLYSRVAVDVDPMARSVRLHAPQTTPAGLPATAIRLPLIVEGTESFVRARVRSRPDAPAVPVKLHLDTGKRDAISLISGRHPSLVPPKSAPRTTSVGTSGRSSSRVARLAVVELAEVSLTNLQVAFVDESSGAFTHGADGRIGAGLLNRFRYIVDYPGGQLILVPHETSLDEDRQVPDAGLVLVAVGDALDSMVVIRAEGGAEVAGVIPGDVVVSIDGVEAAALARGRWPDLLRDKRAGDRLTVCLQSNPGPDCREISLTQGV